MRNRVWRRLPAIAAAVAMLAVPGVCDADQGRGRGRGLESKSGSAPATAKGRGSRGYQDPATINGYDEGYGRGVGDGREGERYDPVRHRDYRDGDRGYADSYGSKDAYRTNFRTGFRQGYEAGYREGARAAR